jgi:hypothetical protein
MTSVHSQRQQQQTTNLDAERQRQREQLMLQAKQQHAKRKTNVAPEYTAASADAAGMGWN